MEDEQILPSTTPSEDEKLERKKQLKRFRQNIERTKTYRRKLISDWQINVDFRRGKPFASQSDEDRIIVPLDWALTKEKESQLWSQLPTVRVSHPPETIQNVVTTWTNAFETKLNDTAVMAGTENAVSECVVDCINASGIGIAVVSREALSETVMVPAVDLSLLPPETQEKIKATGVMPDGTEVPMIPVPNVLDARYTVQRISPADFLWPLGFTGSDFDQSPWIGHSGRISWPEAKQRFKLNDEDKKLVVGESRSPDDKIDKIVYDSEREAAETIEEVVCFDELFYKEVSYDTKARKFNAIHHLVMIDGKDDPVIDEPWKGQSEDPNTGLLIGATKYPIRVLTLTYLTDDAIPPSDSAMGRPQVNEINKSRSQMIKQRERSLPVRWFDVNRVDPIIQHALMRGTWQHMIPVQGNGDTIIGEVARAQLAGDNYNFDKIAKEDYNRSTGMGIGMMSDNVETKAEAQQVSSVAQTRIARERARVAKFYTGITEVLGGLLSIFEEPASFGDGFDPVISRTLSFSILADSTVLLDANQRLQKLMQFINFTAKSGWVNIEAVLREIASLSGLDPSQVIVPPSPKPPVEPNVSLRLTGIADMLNPLALGFLIKSGQAPDIKLIEAAKLLIQNSVAPPIGQRVDPMGQGGFPPVGPDGQPLAPPVQQQLPMEPLPEPAPPNVGEANPQWGALNRVNTRVVERAGEQRND